MLHAWEWFKTWLGFEAGFCTKRTHANLMEEIPHTKQNSIWKNCMKQVFYPKHSFTMNELLNTGT